MKFQLVLLKMFFHISFLIKLAHGNCYSSVAVHEIISANQSVLSINDEAGARLVKASLFSINGCSSDQAISTGSPTEFSETWLSHVNPSTGTNCLQVVVSSYRVMVSFQAVVLRANSWTLKPNFTVSGVSAENNLSGTIGYKESVAVFGVKNKSLVSPSVSLASNSVLKQHNYIVPTWATRNMGLEIGAVMASGAEYAAQNYFNCSESPGACQMIVSFSEHVDALVVLFALAQRAQSNSVSTVTLSEIGLGCGCRCRTSDMGARMVTSSAGATEECVRKESTALLTECDVLGEKWCEQKPNEYFEITGQRLDNGNYPCRVRKNYVAEYLQEFTPISPF